MSEIIKTIAKSTGGTSYKTHKFCMDRSDYSAIDYDDNDKIIWKAYGETERYNASIDLAALSNQITNCDPLFSYFLDGSRRTYKVDDIAYNNRVYPVVAGQIGIGCCLRENKKLKTNDFIRHIVLSLPSKAHKDGWDSDLFFNKILNKINDLEILKKRNFKIDEILVYTFRKDDEKLEDKAVAKIQDKMIDLEISMVANLAQKNLLNNNRYLIKDGSLEYKVLSSENHRDVTRMKNNYRWVVGVSKSFNPEKCLDHSGQSNSNYIANLKPFHRTPVYMYEHKITGDVKFAIWYLRLRKSKFSHGPFEGIVKVEKILVTPDEQENGLDSEDVDIISANLINERNPVCYGADSRWENHLYPIYLTEKFVKSNYYSNKHFLNLF